MATFVGYDTPVRCGTGSYTIFMDATRCEKSTGQPAERGRMAEDTRSEVGSVNLCTLGPE